jgi:rubrerythrin
MFTTHEILDLAIQVEKNGEAVYREAQQHMKDRGLASLFAWLADEETKHAEWFSELKNKVKSDDVDPALQEMGQTILRDVLGDQSFSLKEVNLSQLADTGQILEKAIEFEKDTVIFYEMIGSFVEDEGTLAHLQSIIEEEKRHVQALRDLLSGEVRIYAERIA